MARKDMFFWREGEDLRLLQKLVSNLYRAEYTTKIYQTSRYEALSLLRMYIGKTSTGMRKLNLPKGYMTYRSRYMVERHQRLLMRKVGVRQTQQTFWEAIERLSRKTLLLPRLWNRYPY